jgi:hypothetical protein
MPNATNDKIQTLLERAARRNDSAMPDSSIAKATRSFSTAEEAEKAFAFLRNRLFHVGRWNDYSEISSFALFDSNGKSQPDELAAVGDFIKVTMPGSGKDDWIKITDINESPDEIILTVQPSHDPTDAETKQSTSHFFKRDSTNNFCLQKAAAKINFYVIGLNERSNTQETSGILESARNLATANLGYFLGIQKTQWETFCNNFLEGEEGERVKK